MKAVRHWLACMILLAPAPQALAYPIDGFAYSGIRRLEHTRRLQQEKGLLPAGATLPLSAVVPSGIDAVALPAADAQWSGELRQLLGEDAPHYGVALLDLSDPDDIRFAAHRPDHRANVGSVGKVLVALAWLQTLADWYPHDIAAREQLLRATRVVADEYIVHDHHKLPFPVAADRALWRPLRNGDAGSLWEYLDWMLSASSNAAGSMLMQQLAAAHAFGPGFASGPQTAAERLAQLAPAARGAAMVEAMQQATQRNGLDTAQIRQPSLFTQRGKQRMPGQPSFATPRELVRVLALIEAGRFVDAWSSREAKRLLYVTQKRIRFAAHPVLRPAAVYFKSGSLYLCKPETGFVCGKYRGNKLNQLASVALVEYPAQAPQLRYAVAVMSNVLRKNSAVAHQTLALRIHRMVEARHAGRVQDLRTPDHALPPASRAEAEGRDVDDH